MIGHNIGRVLFLFLLLYFVLALVSSRSQVIALRRSYCGDCSHSCFFIIIVLIIRMLLLSVIFPCCSYFGQVTCDSSEREL
jgi:hypothetical protein